jgi:predicted metal-dependent peptidase
MDPAFERAVELRPQCIIILTDGYMTWPERCRIPTFWLVTNEAMTPPWGIVARMPQGGGK